MKINVIFYKLEKAKKIINFCLQEKNDSKVMIWFFLQTKKADKKL